MEMSFNLDPTKPAEEVFFSIIMSHIYNRSHLNTNKKNYHINTIQNKIQKPLPSTRR